MNTLIKTTAIAIAAFALPVAASAQPQEEYIAVSYADLNLASADGVASLDRRLNRAIKKVCGFADVRQLQSFMRAKRCATEARANVAPKRELAIRTMRGEVLAKGDGVIRFAAR